MKITNKNLMDKINSICPSWVRCNSNYVYWLSSEAQRYYRIKIYSPNHAFFNIGRVELEKLLKEVEKDFTKQE